MRSPAASAALLVLCGQAAWAGEPSPEVAHNAISYQPLAILAKGLVVQYERLLSPFSIVAGTGLRLPARDDFTSVTWVTHTEARWWFVGREPIADFHGMAGPYAAVGFNVARTELEHDGLDRSLGVAWTLEESARLGYRFVIFGLQEISTALALSVVHDFDQDGRLAPITRPSAGLDLSVGWLF
jgi:hypothetical protein